MDDGHGRQSFFSALFEKIKGRNENQSTDDEIMDYLNTEEFDDIAPFQKEMIENILDFDDLYVNDVMTHRTDIAGVEVDSPLKDALRLIIDEGFSRIPVYKEDIDSITGVLFAKDLLTLALDESIEEHTISDFMRKVIYVPETNSCAELFEQLTAKKMQIAVVLDEYGGTAGIVTMEDLLEAIVGNIQDEYDDEEAEIEQITPNMFDCLGSAHPFDVAKTVGFSLPEDKEYDTMAGFFIDLLGRIPQNGENPTVSYDSVSFNALIVNDNRIERIRITRT
ncbi:MAG: hemolysin family protein [Ruminococcus sp.]|nr:hemolysin family protein [Ruminococcus sp.]